MKSFILTLICIIWFCSALSQNKPNKWGIVLHDASGSVIQVIQDSTLHDTLGDFIVHNVRSYYLPQQYGSNVDTFRFMDVEYIRNVFGRLIVVRKQNMDTVFNIPSLDFDRMAITSNGYFLGFNYNTEYNKPMAIVVYDTLGKKIYMDQQGPGVTLKNKKYREAIENHGDMFQKIENYGYLIHCSGFVYFENPLFDDSYSAVIENLGSPFKDFQIVNNITNPENGIKDMDTLILNSQSVTLNLENELPISLEFNLPNNGKQMFYMNRSKYCNSCGRLRAIRVRYK